MSLVEDKLAQVKRLDLQLAIYYRHITPQTVLVLLEVEDTLIPILSVEASIYEDALFQAELRGLIDGWIARAVNRIDPEMTFESDLTGKAN